MKLNWVGINWDEFDWTELNSTQLHYSNQKYDQFETQHNLMKQNGTEPNWANLTKLNGIDLKGTKLNQTELNGIKLNYSSYFFFHLLKRTEWNYTEWD